MLHERRVTMRSLRLLVAGAAVLVAAVSVTAAPAANSTAVTIKLVEPLKAGPIGNESCPDIGLSVNCGNGEARPFGQASEIVSLGACGENCSIRWITMQGDTVVLRETLSDLSCPGACVPEWPHGAPFSGTLTAEIIDGWGVFAGATGTLTGSVKVAAWEAQITYSGTITLA
jgi:hypothetical protein